MFHPQELKQLSLARLRLFLREPEAVFWSIIFPVVLALVLGFAFAEKKVEPSRIAVMAEAAGDTFLAALATNENLRVQIVEDEEEARKLLRKAAVDVIVLNHEPLQLKVDPIRPEAELAQLRLEKTLAPPEMRSGEAQREEEKGFRYIDFLFPGLLGMNFMGTGIWGIGFAVVDMRRKKLLRRFLVTPMRRSSFLLSFLLSRVIFVLLEIIVLMSFAAFILDVPFSGSLFDFAVTCALGTTCFFALGLLVASRPKTLEGASGLMNLVMMPMWLASGVFFSYERYPEFLHPVLRLLPLSAVNDALRSVMLDGAGLGDVVVPLSITTVWAVVAFFCALKVFRWQ